MEKEWKSSTRQIVVIIGPTGVGKTKLSISLAKKLNAVIMNADSMQVYRDMNIGTAKIKENEKEGIEHYLFDIVSPREDYNIFRYQQDGRNLLEKFKKENRNVIIVGGSGLYIKSLLYDYQFGLEAITNTYDDLSNKEILERIKKVKKCDIHVNNRKRLIREFNKKMYDFKVIGLTIPRDKLYEVVDNRVDKMMEEGLLDEVRRLHRRGIRSKAIKTGIGYKELYKYLDKEISLDDAVNLIKTNTRHFIKRQYTFFKHQMDVKWFDVNFKYFNKTIDDIYKYIKEVEK